MSSITQRRASLILHRMRAMLLGGVVMIAAGCASPHEDGTTLTFWTIGREGEAVVKLLPDFERQHPGIHVRVQQLPMTAAHQKLLTAFAGSSF